MVLTEDGDWLLAVNAASNDSTIFCIDNSGLTFANKTNSQGTMPVSLAVYENLVYVLNRGGQGNIAGFQLYPTEASGK